MSKSKAVRPGGLDDLVDRLTDELNTHYNKTTTYTKIQQALAVGDEIDSANIAKLLESVHNDLKSNLKYTANALNIICLLLARYELQVSTEALNLCAFEVVNIIAKISNFNKSDVLLILSWETLIAFPNETILCLCTSHSQAVMGIIESSDKNLMEEQKWKINNLVIKFLRKILISLPLDEKEEFVKEDLSIWFGKVIPSIIPSLPKYPANIDVLELLAHTLIPIQYDENPHWRVILENIYTPKKYPEVIKSLLLNDNDTWCRLWIVLIRLLKNQITKVSNSTGSPINSMLPVVELAFKKEPKYRIQAFRCWNALIDNFACELNEAYVNKRIKLLIIPLRSSNAKVEETALAKFDTWWHLITKFYSKMSNLTEMVLIPFLHFCFGTSIPNPKSPGLPPGQFSDTIQRQCLQALIELCGHSECECVITIPKLSGKLITTNILVQYWDDWIHSLDTVISTVVNDQSGVSVQHLKCLWKSFALNIAELPDNAIRKDLVDTFLGLITKSVRGPTANEKSRDIAIFVLTCTLFEEQRILPLLRQKGKDQGPAYQLLLLLAYNLSYPSSDDQKVLMEKLISVAKTIIEMSLVPPDEVVQGFLNNEQAHSSMSVFWIVLSEALHRSSNEILLRNWCDMLMWPLNSSAFGNNETNIAWKTWITLYESLNQTHRAFVDQEISKWIKNQDFNTAPSCFQLSIILNFVKKRLVKNDLSKCREQIVLLDAILKKQNKGFEEALPILIDTVISILSKIDDGKLTNGLLIATIAINTIKIINQTYTLDKDLKNLMFVDILLKGIERLVNTCPPVMNYILKDILSFLSTNNKDNSLNNKILSLLRTILLNNKKIEENVKNKISSVLNWVSANNTVENSSIADTENKKDFTSPKSVPKKSTKKEPSIIKSVLVNGEQYEVINTHWKFNPKKLTENQKEKLKRKRGDIPALYQDLSQSQDEFKMITWKTDSQDTSNTTTSSKSNSKSGADDVSDILKNMPSTDVVPQIIENIFADHATKESSDVAITADKPLEISKPKITKAALATKDPKSPRIALKDRVFKNVRNLIEKSAIKESDNISGDLNKTVNDIVLKTPSPKSAPSSSVTSSAPPKIATERPSRVIKKPKKFDDTQLISIKKRRRSVNPTDDTKQDSETITNVVQQTGNTEQSEPEKHEILSQAEIIVPSENKSNENQQGADATNASVPNEICEKIQIQEEEKIQNKEEENSIRVANAVACDAITNENKSSKTNIDVASDASAIKKKPPKSNIDEASDVRAIKNKPLETNTDVARDASTTKKKPSEINIDVASDASAIKKKPSKSNIDKASDSSAIKMKPLETNMDGACDASTIKKKPSEINIDVASDASDIKKKPLESHIDVVSDASAIKNKPSEIDIDVASDASAIKKKPSDINIDVASDASDIKKKQLESNIDVVSDASAIKNKSLKNSVEGANDGNAIENCDRSVSKRKSSKSNIDVACDDSAVKRKRSRSSVKHIINGNDKEPVIDDKITEHTKTEEVEKDKSEKMEAETNTSTTSAVENKDDNKKEQLSSPSKDNNKPVLTSTKNKKSRIEKQLLIDMVEGHPLLQVNSEKRVSRRINQTPENYTRRKSLTEKLNKAKIDQKSTPTKNEKKRNSKDKSPTNQGTDTIIVEDSQENNSQVLEDLPQSEDVIESSQDSTMTTISVTSSKHSPKVPVVQIDDKITKYIKSKLSSSSNVQTVLNESQKDLLSLSGYSDKHVTSPNADDTAFPKNKTLDKEKSLIHDLTEEMDTQPIDEKDNSELMIINDIKDTPITIDTEDTTVGTETQEIAEADTLSMDVDMETTHVQNDKFKISLSQTKSAHLSETQHITQNDIIISNTPDEAAKSPEHPLDPSEPVTEECTCSPSKDEQRKKNFLNDTIEISPIKTMSPMKEKTSPTPETSSDYLVIKLATPVQSNGEPFEKSDSPEIFTEDKTSPDKRDQSPPRTAVVVLNNCSPSSSLSLKKNRRSGRAAQMLGLCAIMNSDEPHVAHVDEPKRKNTVSTPVRKNLRVMYSSASDNNESQPDTTNSDESEESENFLKFKRALPTADSSPAIPILKRKLADIADEATVSPASKRKRVSFHDPPVSTTVAVTKYIEPGCIRSPQSSTIKRKDRQLRPSTTMKSAKRLDNVFRLDTILTKTVESFNSEPSISSIDDVELSSMDTTPVVEVVKTSDLNDTDAICPDLVDCMDPIINIASELSSSAMKDLFMKEIEGRVQTIGDLAKMTELEVNRLCIKAPKVKVVKKTLTDYMKMFSTTIRQEDNESPPIEGSEVLPEIEKTSVEVQTLGVELKDIDIQTDIKPVSFISTQTELNVTDASAQTIETGVKPTRKLIEECISERSDFIAQLTQQLPEPSVKQIAATLSPDVSMDLLMQRISSSNPKDQSSLSYLQEYMLKRFDAKHLLLFCSEILHKIHDKKL